MIDTPETVSAADITPKDMPAPTSPASPQGGTVPSEAHNPAPAGSTPAPAPTTPIEGEKDSAGVVWDAVRHIRAKNKHTGRWMPRGGRRPGVPAKSPPAKTESFVPAVVPAPPAEINPPAETTPSAPVVDHSTDAGEVIAQATQLTAGIVLKAPEETRASPAEHKHMVEATAAYIRSKGWQAAAGIGLLLMFTAWLLKVMQRPKARETVAGWFTRPEPRNVTPEDKRPAAPVTETGRVIPPLAT